MIKRIFTNIKLSYLERKELVLLAKQAKTKVEGLKTRDFIKAVRKARRRAIITRRQIHVIPIKGGKLAIVDNEYMKVYNKHAVRKLTATEFKKIAIYSTKWTTRKRSTGN